MPTSIINDQSERSPLINDSNNNDNNNGDTPNNGNNVQKDERTWTYWPNRVSYLAWSTVTREYVNLLLIFVPLGIIAGILNWDAGAIFILNFLAIIPLASLLGFATEELAATMGQALGGLMNATFGNAVELIVCINSLFTCFMLTPCIG